MKTKRSIHVRAWMVSLGSILIMSLLADNLPTPLEKQTIVGNWIGFDQDRVNFCRLQLDADGKGFFTLMAALSPEGKVVSIKELPVNLYRIETWDLMGFDINIHLIPIDPGVEAVFLKGRVGRPELRLEFGGIKTKWTRKLNLFNEKEFYSKNGQAKDRIEKYQSTEKAKNDKR